MARPAVALLLFGLSIELTYAARTDGLAFDEVAYVAAGAAHLFQRDFTVNPEHPPLSKLAAALPLVPLHPVVPPRRADDSLWSWSLRFMHEANDADAIVPRARVANGLFTVLLALVVWAWARRTSGEAAGLVALLLLVFHPSLLAHGHIAGSDLPAALAVVVASFCLWRWSLAPSVPRAAVFGIAAGAALATRLSTAVVAAAFAAVVLVELLARRRGPDPLRLADVGRLVAASAVTALVVIWASYGFQGPAGLLPHPYLEGARRFLETSRDAPAPYLLGRRVPGGSRAYYVVAFLAKSTPGFLLACAAAVVIALRGRRVDAARPAAAGVAWHWAIPAIAIVAVASLASVQIGERYILGAYPYLILLVASAVPALLASPGGRATLAAALLLHAGPSLMQAPHGYLAYFNAAAGLAGGPHHVLGDSNLDWGQDLPRLASWMTAAGVDRVQLAYFGHDDPARFGIRHKDLPGSHGCALGPPRRPFRGWVAVSPSLMTSSPPGGEPYAWLLPRPPDARAGVFLMYRFPE